MNTNTIISLISTVATVVAVIVALALGTVPSILRNRRNRLMAEQRSFSSLELILKIIKDYRFYNPTKIIMEEKEHFSYDLKNIKAMTINVNLVDEIRDLSSMAEYLKNSQKEVLLNAIGLLSKIASGYPYEKKKWDELEELLNVAITELKTEVEKNRKA